MSTDAQRIEVDLLDVIERDGFVKPVNAVQRTVCARWASEGLLVQSGGKYMPSPAKRRMLATLRMYLSERLVDRSHLFPEPGVYSQALLNLICTGSAKKFPDTFHADLLVSKGIRAFESEQVSYKLFGDRCSYRVISGKLADISDEKYDVLTIIENKGYFIDYVVSQPGELVVFGAGNAVSLVSKFVAGFDFRNLRYFPDIDETGIGIAMAVRALVCADQYSLMLPSDLEQVREFLNSQSFGKKAWTDVYKGLHPVIDFCIDNNCWLEQEIFTLVQLESIPY